MAQLSEHRWVNVYPHGVKALPRGTFPSLKKILATDRFGFANLGLEENNLLDFCGGDHRGSCASCWACFRPGALGERLAGYVHGAYAPHAGGLGGSPARAGSPGAHLPAGLGRSRSTADDLGRRQPDHDELFLLSSCAVVAYQTHLRVVPDRPARNGGRKNQSIRHRTNRAATEGSTDSGGCHDVPVSVHPYSDTGGSSLSGPMTPSH